MNELRADCISKLLQKIEQSKEDLEDMIEKEKKIDELETRSSDLAHGLNKSINEVQELIIKNQDQCGNFLPSLR